MSKIIKLNVTGRESTVWLENQRLKAQIERVRELHYRYNAGTACDCCESPPDDCAICGDYYPCLTIKALDGEQS
jgi:hypothetical protein